MTETITLDRVDGTITEVNAMAAGSVSTMQEPARAMLADLLDEDVPAGPLSKAEFLALLARARLKATSVSLDLVADCRDCPNMDSYTPYERVPDPTSMGRPLCTYQCDSGHTWTRNYKTEGDSA